MNANTKDDLIEVTASCGGILAIALVNLALFGAMIWLAATIVKAVFFA